MGRTRAAACPFRVAATALLCLLLAACGGAASPAPSPILAGGAPPTAVTSAAATSAAPVPTAQTSPPAGKGTPPATAATVAQFPTRTPTVTPTPTPRIAMPISPGSARYVLVPQQSRATYRVGEKFLGQGISVRVATASGVTGDLHIDRQRPSASSASAITVNIRGMPSDMSGHDRARDDFLDTRRYPNVVFTPQRLVGLPDTPYAEGEEMPFQIVGEMAVRESKSEVTFDAKGKIVGTTFTGTATATVKITDFGLEVPQMAALELDNNVYLEIAIVAEQK